MVDEYGYRFNLLKGRKLGFRDNVLCAVIFIIIEGRIHYTNLWAKLLITKRRNK